MNLSGRGMRTEGLKIGQGTRSGLMGNKTGHITGLAGEAGGLYGQ